MIGQIRPANPAPRRRGHRLATWRGTGIAAVLLALAACDRTPAPLDHQAYVRQLHWDRTLEIALADGAMTFRGYRVPAAQIRDGAVELHAPDAAALQRLQVPLTVVVRLGATGVDGLAPAARRIVALVETWQHAGVRVAGIEVDPDDGPAQAGACAALLRALREQQPRDVTLVLAVEPQWIGAPAFAAVIAQADETILPMIDAEASGDFDPVVQWRRIDDYGSAARKPFRLALPTPLPVGGESARVSDRQTASVPSHVGSASAEQVAQLLRALERQRPARLAGFVWPGVGDDARAWNPRTVRALIAGESLRPVVEITFDAGADGARHLELDNVGAIDAPAPKVVVVAALGCDDGKALEGFRLERLGDDWRFVAAGAGNVGAGQRRRVGWLRCSDVLGVKIDDKP